MRYFYSIFIFLFGFVLKLLGVFNHRINKWNKDRAAHFLDLNHIDPAFDQGLRVWMHCASLGEYEQGLPIIQALKEKHNECHVTLSFFSPSGYENRRESTLIDHIMYMPLDTKHNAQKMVSILKPHLYIGVKYEFWWNCLKALKDNGSHIIFISVVVPQNVYFLNQWLPFFHWIQSIDFMFTQDTNSLDYLSNIGFTRTVQAGDTRVLSVKQRLQSVQPFLLLEQHLRSHCRILVLGSVYMSDLRTVIPAIKDDVFTIVVPHNVSSGNIDDFVDFFGKDYVLYSRLDQFSDCNKGIIVDAVGMLFSLYQYADIVYVGGGFERSIHNTLEPAVFGVPVSFGPHFQGFKEAYDFIENGLGHCIHDTDEFKTFLDHYESLDAKQRVKDISKKYFETHSGSVGIIMKYLSFLSS